MTFSVDKYCIKNKQLWDNFVTDSINGTFLFQRDFMDYHSHKFHDFSLMIHQDKNLVAILPANISDNVVHSHQGLTYGGLVLKENLSINDIEKIFQSIISFLKQNNIKSLVLKQIPSFYADLIVDSIDSVLIKVGAKKIYSMMNLAIDYSKNYTISKSKLKHNRRIVALDNLSVQEEEHLDVFWNDILTPRLEQKFHSKPVHSLNEIKNLKLSFPSNIRQFSVVFEEKIIAGLTIFESKTVVKSQYGATTITGEKHRALDFLYLFLIEKYKSEGKQFFDMGTVYNNSEVNVGLLNQKSELGCSIFQQNYYEINI